MPTDVWSYQTIYPIGPLPEYTQATGSMICLSTSFISFLDHRSVLGHFSFTAFHRHHDKKGISTLIFPRSDGSKKRLQCSFVHQAMYLSRTKRRFVPLFMFVSLASEERKTTRLTSVRYKITRLTSCISYSFLDLFSMISARRTCNYPGWMHNHSV